MGYHMIPENNFGQMNEKYILTLSITFISKFFSLLRLLACLKSWLWLAIHYIIYLIYQRNFTSSALHINRTKQDILVSFFMVVWCVCACIIYIFFLCVCVYICMPMYLYVWMCTCLYMCAYICEFLGVCMFLCLYLGFYVHFCIGLCMYFSWSEMI